MYLTSGVVAGTRQWADGVRIHDSTIEGTGRMGVSITDGARNVVVEHNDLDQIALYVFDIEPNGLVFDGVPAGAEHVRYTNNQHRHVRAQPGPGRHGCSRAPARDPRRTSR